MATQPILFLNIEQGPKAGCRLECKAAAITTVGRARASTLQISRDPGISQKHIYFQLRGDDEHVGWTAMDVGSSNGTIINDVLVEPHNGVYIHTGDLIKIGSETTIRVEILGVPDEVMAVPKVKECSKRKGACITSESHGKGMPVVAGRHACKAGHAAGKAVAAQECQGKQLDIMEGTEVYHNVVEGHGKEKDGMTDKVYHGNQHSNISEGECHGKQQDAMAGVVFPGNNYTNHAAEEGHGKRCGNMTAYRDRQGKHDINKEAEEGRDKQGRSTRAYKHHQEKHGINNVCNDQEHNTAKVESTSRDHEHEAENVAAASTDIDLSMTVEHWFRHLMEEGPKYLHQVSESIIQDVMLESKQFDEYVLSLS